MNAKQAKEQIRLVDFLAERGIRPARQRNGVYWYSSPLRNEKTPSFAINENRNIWFDHGDGRGGDLIKLVQLMHNVDVSGALRILSDAPERFSFLTSNTDLLSAGADKGGLIIRKVQPLQNRALVQYITGRGIPLELAGRYVEECYYTTPERSASKSLFALAFKNDLGGYELRNKGFKGATHPKGITTVQGVDRTTAAVFEGFIDFLSALVYYGRNQPVTNAIILNGLGNIGAALDALETYSKVNLFLDNDSAGAGAIIDILNYLPTAVNRSKTVYPDHKDFNEFLTTTRAQ